MTEPRVYQTGEKLRDDSMLTYICEAEPKIYWDKNGNKRVKLRKAFFLCECGGLTESYITDVKLGKSKACSCIKDGKARERLTTHGNSGHPLYSTWEAMKRRCYNKTQNKYHLYGGRGIKVCDRWLENDDGFKNFVTDMGTRPEGFTLDRIDSNGDYSPENCRWADLSNQGYNKRLTAANTSGSVGVSYDKFNKKWLASITKDYVHKNLGRFDLFEDAVNARRKAELEYYGYNNNYWLEEDK